MVIGAVMCVSNLYVVLKAGWSIGVTVTACILAFAIFRLLRVLKLAKGEFTELENNAMGSVASAAGYMTGGGNMAAVPALMLLTGVRPPTVPLMLWFGTIAALGVFAAIPIKRQMINLEQLPFPSGTATAETIKTLHAHGDEGIRRAKYLGLAALFSGLLVWIKDAKIPFGIPAKLGLAKWMPWSISFDVGTVFVGVGAIVGMRTAWSMLVFGGHHLRRARPVDGERGRDQDRELPVDRVLVALDRRGGARRLGPALVRAPVADGRPRVQPARRARRPALRRPSIRSRRSRPPRPGSRSASSSSGRSSSSSATGCSRSPGGPARSRSRSRC